MDVNKIDIIKSKPGAKDDVVGSPPSLTMVNSKESIKSSTGFYSLLKGWVTAPLTPTTSVEETKIITETETVLTMEEDKKNEKPKEEEKPRRGRIFSFSGSSTPAVVTTTTTTTTTTTNIIPVIGSPPNKKEENLKGAVQVTCSTLFGDSITSTIQPSTAETTLLETLQKKPNELIPNELTSPRSNLRGAVPMARELKIIATAPFDNKLNKVPMDVWSLLTLQILHIERNEIAQIPAQIGQLASLQHLYLAHNHIKTIAPEIKNLTSLTYLNLSGNQLVSLPNVGSFTKLEHLFLQNNLLASLPSDIGDLVSLKILLCNNNKITNIPASMANLSCIQKLDLSHNLLVKTNKKGVEFWKNYTNMTSLHLQNNKLSDLSPSLQYATQLADLDISHNYLTSLPPTLDKLTRLTKLNASHNNISILPVELSGLVALKTLSLAFNKLTSLFDLSQMTELTELNLSNNQLTTIPPLPSRLLHLNIKSNHLTCLPQELSLLSDLLDLDASHNNIASLELFTPTPGLVNLKSLNLSNNSLHLLVPEICSLPALKSLDISENILISIPAEIKKLTTLENLYLHSAKVMVVPTALPLSLNELTLANLSVNKIKNQVSLTHQDIKLNHQLNMLIQVTRSVQHPLTIFALGHYFTDQAEHREILLQQGMLSEFFDFVVSESTSIRLEATRALANIFEYITDKIHDFIEDKYLDILVELINKFDLETTLQAIRCVCNLSYSMNMRKKLLEKHSLDVFINMRKDATDDQIKSYLNKLLNILGAQDFLHFPSTRKRGVRILSMDGGGTRALVTLEILKKIEETSGKRIPELFDIIVGTSTGGVLASMLGVRQFTLDRIEGLYKEFARIVFLIGTNPNSEPAAWSKLFNYTNLIKSGAFYKAETLLDCLAKRIGSDVMIDTTMAESNKDVKVCFVSTLTSISPPEPYVFRNYNYPMGSESRYYGDCRTKLQHALRASTAAPSYFEEYIRENEIHQDGAIVANNPAAIALHEAKSLWPDRPIECLVSLGTGSPATKNVKNKGVMQSIMKTLVRAATSPKPIHDILSDLMPPEQYFRFNPIHESMECGLDETNEERLVGVQLEARRYIEENMDRVRELCEILQYTKHSE